jgi:sec-independent protein translocase protein TatB
MFDIGFLELVLVGIVALLVLGPERLPTAARTAGKWVGKARRMVSQVSQEIDRELKADELREKLKMEGDTLGLDKIQGTVQEALDKAKDFEHLINQDATRPAQTGVLESTTSTVTTSTASPPTASSTTDMIRH